VRILVVCLIVVGISPTRAAAPTSAVKAPSAPVKYQYWDGWRSC
jgi:hypothetical protein